MIEINVTNFVTIAAISLFSIIIFGAVERHQRGKNEAIN